ncbi:MAG: preprotein translocase subunit SecG [Muribaculaceae bacterium]|nr:preprotein translocase subunit SecG [Muribaculaceae bacterium]
MFIFLSVLITIASLLLVGVVLIQKSKGGGLASNVSGYNQMLGVRKTTDFIEKTTWGLAIFICLASIVTVHWNPNKVGKQQTTAIEQQAQQNQTPNTSNPAQGGGEAPAQQQ